ncbi:hypothetical protein ABMY35_14425 [Pseudoalteromonas sp. BZB3]|uniref:hypothetical protein n=1 Tax=Pseudoalteromonas sp. BZB3 TaxID=3136670 RepID=UPI0032C3F50B
MLDLVFNLFFLCFFLLVILMLKYLNSLDDLLLIKNSQQEIEKLTLSFSKGQDRLMLMRDIRFYFLLITGKYKTIVDSDEMLIALGICRKYLLFQYPLAIVMFLIPIINKLAQ